MSINLKRWLVSGTFFMMTLLMACGHSNPLLNDSTINRMKGLLMFEKDDFPIRECATYYAGDGDASLQTKCDAWTASYYKTQMKLGEIPTTASLTDYRDPQFWKAIEPK